MLKIINKYIEGMKSAVVVLLCLISSSFFAQNFSVERGSFTHAKELRHAIHVKLEPEAKEVSSEWRSFIRSKLDLRLKGNWRERRAEGVEINKLSDSTLSLYFRFNEIQTGTEFFIVMKYENGDYFSHESNSNEFQFMENLVHDFLRDYLPGYYNNLIEETNKEISKLEKSIKSTKKSIERNDKSIEKNKSRIRSLEDDTQQRQRENQDLKKAQAEAEKVNAIEKSTLQERRSKLERAKNELLKTKN